MIRRIELAIGYALLFPILVWQAFAWLRKCYAEQPTYSPKPTFKLAVIFIWWDFRRDVLRGTR